MMNPSKPIIFFGTDEFSAASLKALLEGQFDVILVVTKPDNRKCRGQRLTKPAAKHLAETYHIPVIQPHKLLEIENELHSLIEQYPEGIAGVLVSYGKIIPKHIIDLFTPGIINVHPSLLPLYRGPSPIESAIANGDSQTGVTIMQLSPAMDAGPIYVQQNYQLNQTETQPELYKILAGIGAQLLTTHLPVIVSGQSQPTAQNDTLASYCQLLSKDNQQLFPQTISAVQAERRVRAFIEFPKTKYLLSDTNAIFIMKSHVDSTIKSSVTKNSPLTLVCKDGEFLVVDELISSNGKYMSSEQFLSGYRST